MVVVALLSVELVESVDLVSVELVVNCITIAHLNTTEMMITWSELASLMHLVPDESL